MAQVVADDAAITKAKRKAGRFILATNDICDPTLTAEQVLSDYKGQYAPERSFGLLKDPLFFTSSVFLKTPQRIAALVMVMGLAVMVYTLAQRQLRQALVDANETVLDQRKQLTQTPILRWIFLHNSIQTLPMESLPPASPSNSSPIVCPQTTSKSPQSSVDLGSISGMSVSASKDFSGSAQFSLHFSNS
jgi:hypothetical protein